MSLDAEQLRDLCRRRDAGVVAGAASGDPIAAHLLAGVSADERRALVADGKAARTQMVEQNLGLVGFAIARFRPTAGLERADYFQEGVIGLAEAVDRYDPDRTAALSTFALPRIRGAVSTLINTRGGDLHQAQGRVAAEVEREIARREAAGLSATTADVARSLQRDERAVTAAISYRAPTTLTPSSGRGEYVGDRSGTHEPASLEDVRIASAARLLLMLPEQEQRVLRAVYDDTGVKRTMSEVAGDLGMGLRSLRATLDSGRRHLASLMSKADPDLADRLHQGQRKDRDAVRPQGHSPNSVISRR